MRRIFAVCLSLAVLAYLIGYSNGTTSKQQYIDSLLSQASADKADIDSLISQNVALTKQLTPETPAPQPVAPAPVVNSPKVDICGPHGCDAKGCPKNQFVNAYYRKDGTYVNAYWRNDPYDSC